MARWTKVFPSYSTLYSYVQVDNWAVHGDRCTFDLSGGITSPYYWNVGGISCEIGWWESGTYHPIDTDTVAYNQNGGDKVVFGFSDYFTRQAADRTVYLYHEAQASGTAYAESTAYTVPHLAPSVTWASVDPVVRNSDTSITLKWNAPSLEYSAMCLEVSIDGGSWSQFAVLWNTATSYTWNGASAGHSYQFRIRSNYLASYSAYDVYNTVITMTPTAPTAISTAAISGGTDIAVTLENASTVATSVEWQYSTDNKATWSASTTVNGSPVTSFTATGITGTAYIRVANKNSTGTSAWLVSDAVTTICPPNPPTLTAPSGNVLDLADGNVTFSWLHNSLDGSAQSAAQLDYSTNGGSTWTSITSITTAQSYTMAIPWSAGTTVTWRVKTKGADANYSNWSSTKSFNVCTAPTLVITSPGATITGMPISVSATYSDMAGFTCQAATVTLPNGQMKNCTIAGTAITASIGVDEWLPTNGESYTIMLTVRSSSSLQTSANATFAVAFIEPSVGNLNVTNDKDTGYASLLATFDNDGSDVHRTGNTNEQYEIEPSSCKMLTVQGQSEVQSGTLASIEHVYVVGMNLIPQDSAAWEQKTSVESKPIGSTWEELKTAKSNRISLADLVPVTPGGTYYFYITDNYDFFITYFGNSGYLKTFKVWFKSGAVTVASNVTGIGITVRKSNNTDLTPSDVQYAQPVLSHMLTDVITTSLRSAGSVHDELQAGKTEWTVLRRIGTRAYQAGDESDPDVLTDNTNTYYALTTPTTDAPTSYTTIEFDNYFSVFTEINSTFEMTTWDGSAEAVSISVARVNADGTPIQLIDDGASGSGAVDKYAPLNKAYKYAVTTHAATHAVKTVYVDNIIETDLWFAYWTVKDGENTVEKMASAKWNPDNGGIQIARPQKTRVYYAGRKDPVSYDGAAVSLTETPSWVLVEREEAQPFVQLIEDGGRGVYKSCDGWVYHADFDLTLSPKYTAIGYYGGIMLSVTRIAGDQL